MNDKLMDVIASMAIGESIFQLPIYFLIGGSNIFLYIAATVCSTLISGTLIYNVVRKIRKKHEEDNKKRANCVKQTIKGILEIENEDNEKINQDTSIFLNEIKSILEQESIDLEGLNINTINDLIYLINANYYYEIQEKIKLDREDLIEMIVIQIAIYLEENNIKELKDNDIAVIINNCFFIGEKIKKEIIAEFNDTAVEFGSCTYHSIENRHSDLEKTKIESKNEKVNLVFDINNIEHYKWMVEVLTAKDTYLREYGDVDNLEWDYQALKNVISIMINNYEKELKELDLEMGFQYLI